jgi:hypothetical protein
LKDKININYMNL